MAHVCGCGVIFGVYDKASRQNQKWQEPTGVLKIGKNRTEGQAEKKREI